MWIDDRNPDFIVVYQHQPTDHFVKKMYWDTERQGWVLERNVTPLVIARDWLRSPEKAEIQRKFAAGEIDYATMRTLDG